MKTIKHWIARIKWSFTGFYLGRIDDYVYVGEIRSGPHSQRYLAFWYWAQSWMPGYTESMERFNRAISKAMTSLFQFSEAIGDTGLDITEEQP